jgi:hypothetical protein
LKIYKSARQVSFTFTACFHKSKGKKAITYMSWTAVELLAIQEADRSIEETFETCEAYSREQMLLDRWLDKIARIEQGLCQYNHQYQQKRAGSAANYYLSKKAVRIAYQKRYRQENKEMIALKKKAVRRANRRHKYESVDNY